MLMLNNKQISRSFEL